MLHSLSFQVRKYMKKLKILYKSLIVAFILMNTIAGFHAYHFTHVSNSQALKTGGIESLSWLDKIEIMVLGVAQPKPMPKAYPQRDYQTIKLPTKKSTVAWYIPIKNAKGCIALFHGYGGEKSSMLSKSNFFNELGYSTLLIDAWGAGESEGNQITIGYKESRQVTAALYWMKKQGYSQQILMGTSMGAASILKAVNETKISPTAIIIECPFGSLKATVEALFCMMGLPTFPMANLLVFWGGLENGFNAFDYQPAQYAKNIHCPTLLFYGAKDPKISMEETKKIYQNLKGPKDWMIFENSGHVDFWHEYASEWKSKTRFFLQNFQ